MTEEVILYACPSAPLTVDLGILSVSQNRLDPVYLGITASECPGRKKVVPEESR